MADQLPKITGNRAVNTTATATPTSSSISRGLCAIQNKQIGISQSELDVRYRQARKIYDRITCYGKERHFDEETAPKQDEQIEGKQLSQLHSFFAMIKELSEVHSVFQQLAVQGYGKAYFPLVMIYLGGQGKNKDAENFLYYNRLVFDWNIANQTMNDPEIWRDLGWMYQYGYGVEQSDRQAVFWYCKAAENGHSDAQFNLGRMYRLGYGVTQDYEQAAFWCRKSAEQDHTEAQKEIGQMYYDGLGVTKDPEQAAFWYHKIADQCESRKVPFWLRRQGEFDAQNSLGWMYQNGYGVVQNYEQAIFWYRKAAEQGGIDAQKNLYNLGINWKDT